MNKRNFKKVLDQISKHPETWNQENWHCDTTHCFFGWAQLIFRGQESLRTIRKDGMKFLGLSKLEADYLADSSRRLKDFQCFYKGDLSRYMKWIEESHTYQTAFPE